MTKAIIILSGGMDSGVLLADSVGKYEKLYALTFDYGAKHNHKEIPMAKALCNKYSVEHTVVALPFINELFASSLLQSGDEIPEGSYADTNMQSTVVPFRNGIMLSIAVGFAESKGAGEVLIGSHAGDHPVYPDCGPDFTIAISKAARLGTYPGIVVKAPFSHLTKKNIAELGRKLDFDFSMTWTCYKRGEEPCGVCAACREREEALAPTPLSPLHSGKPLHPSLLKQRDMSTRGENKDSLFNSPSIEGDGSPLGRAVQYRDTYDKSLLFAILRSEGRGRLEVGKELPFVGEDAWYCHEMTWLGNDGTPKIAKLRLRYPYDSTNIVESKSLKLYLGSFHNTRFTSVDEVSGTIAQDLKQVLKTENLAVDLLFPDAWNQFERLAGGDFADKGVCIDHCEDIFPKSVNSLGEVDGEILYSHLLRSVCPVTGQPDMGTVVVRYSGNTINKKKLLAMIISLRNHQGFHEECCERLFLMLQNEFCPKELSVECRYERRGGIAIVPKRCSCSRS